MLYMEIIAVCYKYHMQYKNTLHGKNRLANATPCNTYSKR